MKITFKNRHLKYLLYILPLVIPKYLLINFQIYESKKKMLTNKKIVCISIFVGLVLLTKESKVIECLQIVKKVAKYGPILQGLRLRNW